MENLIESLDPAVLEENIQILKQLYRIYIRIDHQIDPYTMKRCYGYVCALNQDIGASQVSKHHLLSKSPKNYETMYFAQRDAINWCINYISEQRNV